MSVQLTDARSVTTMMIADLDQDGDPADLVQMMIQGHFEKGPSDDVAWSSGDWNCDGLVDSNDLVAMMQLGHYAG